jgi:hypothetical protein
MTDARTRGAARGVSGMKGTGHAAFLSHRRRSTNRRTPRRRSSVSAARPDIASEANPSSSGRPGAARPSPRRGSSGEGEGLGGRCRGARTADMNPGPWTPTACDSPAAGLNGVRAARPASPARRYSAFPTPTRRVIRWVPPSTHGTPHRAAERGEGGHVAGDGEVTPAGQLDPAGDAPPLHRGDPRLARLQVGEPQRSPAPPVIPVNQSFDVLQVRSRAERVGAGSGQHQRRGLGGRRQRSGWLRTGARPSPRRCSSEPRGG